MQLIAKSTDDMQKLVWAEAANHEHGSGLEFGMPSFAAARKAISYFKKNGLHAAAKGLSFSLVGIFRDPKEDDVRTIACCHRCGKRARATRFHVIYECSDNDKIEVDIFRKTNRLLRKARREWRNAACYWLRGIVPFSKRPTR